MQRTTFDGIAEDTCWIFSVLAERDDNTANKTLIQDQSVLYEELLGSQPSSYSSQPRMSPLVTLQVTKPGQSALRSRMGISRCIQ
jgi:hypothetical protein